MAGRSAGVGEGALVQLDDVPPPQPGQVVRDAVAHDPRADDDDARPVRQRVHCLGISFVGSKCGIVTTVALTRPDFGVST